MKKSLNINLIPNDNCEKKNFNVRLCKYSNPWLYIYMLAIWIFLKWKPQNCKSVTKKHINILVQVLYNKSQSSILNKKSGPKLPSWIHDHGRQVSMIMYNLSVILSKNIINTNPAITLHKLKKKIQK